jgi:hypothetical protein
MPVLSIAANSLSNFHQYIIKSNKPQIYEQSYESLLFFPLVHMDGQFTDLPSHQLKSMSNSVVNYIFSNHLNLHFPNSMVIYTDGSVSRLSAGYSFYIPVRANISNDKLCRTPTSSTSDVDIWVFREHSTTTFIIMVGSEKIHCVAEMLVSTPATFNAVLLCDHIAYSFYSRHSDAENQ